MSLVDTTNLNTTSLLATITRLRAALAPFAETARLDIDPSESDDDHYQPMIAYASAPPLRNLDFRRALAALTEE